MLILRNYFGLLGKRNAVEAQVSELSLSEPSGMCFIEESTRWKLLQTKSRLNCILPRVNRVQIG